MRGMPDAVIEDAWQARMDRTRRLLPIPLLLVSTVAATTVAATQHTWTRLELGLPAVAVVAVWSSVVTARIRPDTSESRRLAAFAVHTVLAGFLVWISLPYGVFAYAGFLFAYRLGAPSGCGSLGTRRGCLSSPPTTPTGTCCPPSRPGPPGTCSRTLPGTS